MAVVLCNCMQPGAAPWPVSLPAPCMPCQCRLFAAVPPSPQAFRPCPTSICCHGGAFYLTTHTTHEGTPTHGCLSVWSPQGELLVVHRLAEGVCCHPNAVAVFTPAGPLPAGMRPPE